MKRTKKRVPLSSIDLATRMMDVKYMVDQIGECWRVKNYSAKSTSYPRYRSIDDGRMKPIARDMWELTHRMSIPQDKVVIRKCGSRDCINPDHLELRDRKTTQEMMIERRKAERREKRKVKDAV